MITVDDKNRCAGCTACVMSCPRHAITMVQDEKGFQYPKLNPQLCVDCGLCDDVCPFHKTPVAPPLQEAYAVKHQDSEILAHSTSGGFFTALSDYVLDSGGVVYGAAFDDAMVVRHMRATTKEERNRMRGSKYVQSDLGEVFYEVKQDLKDNKLVLFTGTPCQIAGLKSVLKGQSEGLICCDLICHGVPSPLIFSEHLKLLAKKLKQRIVDYRFRPKTWGWYRYKEVVCCENGKEYHSMPYTDLWRSLYYSRIIMRPSCNSCPYSNLNRCGDVTIGDCHGIDGVRPEFGSEDGVSLAIVNTKAGKEVFEGICNSITYELLNIEDVMQPPLRQSSQPNKASEAFFSMYRKYGYKKAIMNYYGRLYPLKYYVKKWVKRN